MEHDWPENVTLPWSSFKPVPPQPLQHYIPEIESDAQDLLEVIDRLQPETIYSRLTVLLFFFNTQMHIRSYKKFTHFQEELINSYNVIKFCYRFFFYNKPSVSI